MQKGERTHTASDIKRAPALVEITSTIEKQLGRSKSRLGRVRSEEKVKERVAEKKKGSSVDQQGARKTGQSCKRQKKFEKLSYDT